MDKISIIIPCFWSSEELVKMSHNCFKSCRATTPANTDIVVVNDGSPLNDESATITMPENQGYAAAVNVGLAQAKGDYLIVCNNDIEFIQPDWLSHLLKPLDEGYAISSIRTSDSDGYNVEDRYEENAKFGSIWAMKRSTYQILGSLDKSFGRGYYEDQDYWRRARELGLKIVKNHNGLVDHLGKATFNEVDEKSWHLVHAMLMYKKKWGDKMHIYETQPNVLLGVDDYDKDDPGYAIQITGLVEETWEDLQERWKAYL